MIFFPLFFGPFFALKKFGFPLKAGDAVFPRSWPEGVCRPLLRYALRYSLTWDKRHKHEIPGEVLSAKQSHEWDNLIPPAAQRLPETSAAAWSSSRGPVTQIWELVSNQPCLILWSSPLFGSLEAIIYTRLECCVSQACLRQIGLWREERGRKWYNSTKWNKDAES